MELMASLSSALLVLSLQHVSIHAQRNCFDVATLQVLSILRNPAIVKAVPRFCISWKDTSPLSSHVWERIAYFSRLGPSLTWRKRRVSVSRSHISHVARWPGGL